MLEFSWYKHSWKNIVFKLAVPIVCFCTCKPCLSVLFHTFFPTTNIRWWKKLISPIDNVKGLKKLEEKYWRPAEEKDKHDHRQHWHHLLYCIALHWKYVMSNKMPTIRIHDCSGKPTFLIWAFSRDSFSHWSHFLSSRPWWFNLYQSNSNVHHKPTHIDQEKGQFQNTKLPERIHLVVFAPRIICSELNRSRRALLIFSAASHTAPGLLRYNWWQIVGCDIPFPTTLRYIAKHYWLPPYRRAKTPKSRSKFWVKSLKIAGEKRWGMILAVYRTKDFHSRSLFTIAGTCCNLGPTYLAQSQRCEAFDGSAYDEKLLVLLHFRYFAKGNPLTRGLSVLDNVNI